MKINGFNNRPMFGAYQTHSRAKKSNQPNETVFAQTVKNEQPSKTESTNKTSAATPLTPEEEMAAFKQEIYDELAEINRMSSPLILSNSVHVTEDGFQRMKEDPEYRKKIMDWLREDARVSYNLPFGAHSTTTITGEGATARMVSDDLYRKDPSTKTMFDEKSDNSFFSSNRSDRAYADRKAAQRKRDSEYVENERHKRELMQKMILEQKIDGKIQQQAIDKKSINRQAFQQQYLDNYMLGMQLPKNRNI